MTRLASIVVSDGNKLIIFHLTFSQIVIYLCNLNAFSSITHSECYDSGTLYTWTIFTPVWLRSASPRWLVVAGADHLTRMSLSFYYANIQAVL